MTFDEAKACLEDAIQDDGDLHHLGWYLLFRAGNTSATLDGVFNADDLEAIAVYMRNVPSPDKTQEDGK